jgi:outer membrane protein TolC
VEAAQANVQLAERLLQLARSQRQAGVAAGIDVARAETRLANQQVQLAQARTQLDTAQLELLRLIGAPLSERPALSGKLEAKPEPARNVDASIQAALKERADASVAAAALGIADSQRKAATAGYAPSLSFFADYGSSGLKPNELNYPTRTIGVRLDVPVFDGGRTRSEVQIAASRRREAEAQLRDVRATVEKDVRLAIDNLATRLEQARAAETALNLATRELELAQSRFSNGVADNIEVVQAQTSLENARLGRIASLGQYSLARLNLAAALGRAADFQL